MEEALPQPNSTTTRRQDHLEPENEIPKHHNIIWTKISAIGSKGRTYYIAKCCATIFDSRSQTPNSTSIECTESTFSHPKDSVQPLTEYLGKRSQWTEKQLSSQLAELEKAVAENYQTTYGTSHKEGQLQISVKKLQAEVDSLRNEVHVVRSEAQARSDDLQYQISSLSEKSSFLQKAFQKAEEDRNRANAFNRSLLQVSKNLCQVCQPRLSLSGVLNEPKEEN